jgi:hypothetical protein
MFPYVLVETYLLHILIIVRDTLGPCLTLGEPTNFIAFQVRNLPGLAIGVLLQKCNLPKVNAESKTQIACHMLILPVLIWAYKCFLIIRFSKIWSYVMYYTCNALTPAVTSLPLTRTVSHNQDHYGVSIPK